MSICFLCDKEFEDSQGRNRKRCHSCNTKIRRYRTKQAAIEYLGGSCVKCGYDEHQAALEFHHKDPSQKEFQIGKVANKSWEIVKKELDKCELLCANCHAVEHSSKQDEAFLKEVENYKGRKLIW